jgi:KUP system potassium uptake protein
MVGEHVDPRMKEEMSATVKAKHPGVAYIMGHSYVFKKFAIDLAYNFLWKNCRCPADRYGAQHTAHQPHRCRYDLLRLA